MKEVIVSAYNRDYSWVNQLNSDVKATIYRKGINHNNHEIFIENNVGRDVHTFFYHFLKNYDTLSDFTFTTQDYYEDHVYNYLEMMNSDRKTWDKNCLINFSNCWFFCTNYPLLTCDKWGSPHHNGLDIEPIWNMLFVNECPDKLYFAPAGHFCITKEHARKRPKQFYQKIVNILETDEMSPWVIERLEGYIFDLNYEIKL